MNRIATLIPLVILYFGGASTSLAAPTLTNTVCGATVSVVTRTATGTFDTPSETPVLLTGCQVVVTVPTGAERCIRVRFSAAAYCPYSCFLTVLDNTDSFLPSAFIAPSLRFAQNTVAEAHSFEWIKRVGPGRHIVKLQIQTGNTLSSAQIGPYTITVEVLN